jgi:hypothetical protein
LPKCIEYTGVKGSHSTNKKIKFWIQQRSKEATEGTSSLGAPDCPVYTGQCPVHHRTVSGAPPDNVRCTRGLRLELATFGNFSGLRAIIHRTVRCTPDSVRCSKEARPPEHSSLGNAQQPLRYNSPDMSGVHRTVRCNHEATTISAPTAICVAFNARTARAEVRRAHTGAPDNEQEMSGVHRTSRRAQKSEAPTVRIQRHW